MADDDTTRPVGLPTVQPDGRVVQDVELALSGLLVHHEPLGGRVPPPEGRPAREPSASMRVPAAVAVAAARAGTLVVLDDESTPVAALHDVHRDRDDPSVVSGVLRRVRTGETGVGRDLRSTPAGSSGAGHVVVLGRPPLAADVVTWDAATVLVVPVGSASPDGVPPATMLRAARAVAAEGGNGVVTVPVAWRDPASDANLVAHVSRGLRAGRTTHLRPAAADLDRQSVRTPGTTGPGDGWAQLLASLVAGTLTPSTRALATPAVLRELLRWRPPRSRRGLVVLFTGLSGSGKSTIARDLAERLGSSSHRSVSLLDGDVVRRLLSSGLGFSPDDRDLNVRRIGYVASEVARHGGVAICAPIAPYERSRAAFRAMVEEVGDMVLVHVSTPLHECERRDLKGLYGRARAGEVAAFTGISDPYEEPTDADLAVDTSTCSREEAMLQVLRHLARGGWIDDADESQDPPTVRGSVARVPGVR